MDKQNTIKLIIQHLKEKGYNEVSSLLEQEAQVSSETEELRDLKTFISTKNFDEAVNLIVTHCSISEKILIIPKIRILQLFDKILENFHEDKKENEIAQKTSLEFLRDLSKSKNIYEKDSTISKCSSLFFIQSKTELLAKMKQLCPASSSRERLLEFIQSTLSKSKSLLKTLYPSSLERMVKDVVKDQIEKCGYHNMKSDHTSYFEDHICDKTLIPTEKAYTLDNFKEAITNLVLSQNETYFAAVLKNNSISVYQISHKNTSETSNSQDLDDATVISLQDPNLASRAHQNILGHITINISFVRSFTPHKDQITSLSWHSNETWILTGSKDQTIKVWNIETGDLVLKISDNVPAAVSSVIWFQDESMILGLFYDQSLVLWNLKGEQIETSKIENISSEMHYSRACNTLVMSVPVTKAIIIYDCYKREQIDKLPINDTIISLALTKLDGGTHLLVNSSNETPIISLWDLKERKLLRKYFGHRQDKLSKYCAFGGANENFLVCGSDTKEIYIWNRKYSLPVYVIPAHSGVVNAVIWPKTLSSVIISASDDHTVRIFTNRYVRKVQEQRIGVNHSGPSNRDEINTRRLGSDINNGEISAANVVDGVSHKSEEEEEEDEEDESESLNQFY